MRGRNIIDLTLVLPFPSSLMFWHSLIRFWDYLFHFLPLLSHSPPWLWWSRFSMIVWSTTSPQIKHRQLKKGPFGPKNSSWIIIPLHRSHFTLSSPKLSLWDHRDWNKVNAVFYWKNCYNYNLLSFLGPSDGFRNHGGAWGRSCRACEQGVSPIKKLAVPMLLPTACLPVGREWRLR